MEIKVDCFDIRQIADSGQCFRMKEHPTKKDTFTVVVGVDYIEITQAAGSHSIELPATRTHLQISGRIILIYRPDTRKSLTASTKRTGFSWMQQNTAEASGYSINLCGKRLSRS